MSPYLRRRPDPPTGVTIAPSCSAVVAAACIAVAWLGGCASREPVEAPFAPQPLEVAESRFFGTPLSGPRAGDLEGLRAEDTFGVRAVFMGLETLPDGALQPLASRRTLLAVSGAGKPVQTTERLSRGVRVGKVVPAGFLLASLRNGSHGRTAVLAAAEGAVLPGSTWRLRLRLGARADAGADSAAERPDAVGAQDAAVVAPASTPPEVLDVEIYFPSPGETGDAGLRVAIACEGLLAPKTEEIGLPAAEPLADEPADEEPAAEEPAGEEQPAQTAPQDGGEPSPDATLAARDLVLAMVRKAVGLGEPADTRIDVREVSLVEGALRRPGDALAGILSACPAAGAPLDDRRCLAPAAAGIAFVVEVIAAPGMAAASVPAAARLDAFQRSADALAEVAAGEIRVADIEAELLKPTAVLARAIGAFVSPATRRRALLYVARETGARLAADVALSSADDVLAAAGDAILQRLREIEEIGEKDALKDAMGWALESGTLQAAGKMLEGEARVPELEGVLALHLGQVGRQAAAIERVLAESRSLSDLEARLVRENFTFLEDGSPQARARAFAWLSERGRAPAGYDPLAPARERRIALEKAMAEPAAAPDTQGGNP